MKGTFYTVKGLTAGTKYNVRVRAYKTNGGNTVYGTWKNGSAGTSLPNMTGFKLKSKTTNSLTLQWNKNSGATGYQLGIYKGGKWATYNVKGTSYTVKGLTAGTKYNVRVRAYKTSGGNTVYGCAPTEIIYRICLRYILGFGDKIHIEKNNIRLCDTLEYAKNGTLRAEIEKLFEL